MPAELYGYAELDAPFYTSFGVIEREIRLNWGHVHEIHSPFGVHGVVYTEAEDSEEPEEGDYAVIGFVMPDGVYAEIEDSTYGILQGFRIYRNDGAAVRDMWEATK